MIHPSDFAISPEPPGPAPSLIFGFPAKVLPGLISPRNCYSCAYAFRYRRQCRVTTKGFPFWATPSCPPLLQCNTTDGKAQRRHASQIYRMLLWWIAHRPPSTTIIIEAVAFNESDGKKDETINLDYIPPITQGFIEKLQTGTLRFAHASVEDVLRTKHESDFNDATCHAEAARKCLTYLSSRDNIAYIKDLGKDDTKSYISPVFSPVLGRSFVLN